MSSRATERLVDHALHLERLGDWEQAGEVYSLLFREAVAQRDIGTVVDALRGGSRMRRQGRRYEEAVELAELSREIAERSGLGRQAARAINEVAVIHHLQQDWSEARELYERALELALDVGDDTLIGWASLNLGVVANILGNLREARSRYLESIGSSVRSGDKSNAMMAYNNLGMVCADLQEWIESEIYFSRGIEIAERVGDSPLLARLYTNLAEPLIHIGEHAQAGSTLDRGEAVATRIGDLDVLAAVARLRGVNARAQGDLPAAKEYLGRALRISEEGEIPTERGPILEELALVLWLEGRPEEACGTLAAAREVFRSIGAKRDAARVGELLAEWTGRGVALV